MSKTNKIICYVVACMLILCVAVLMFGCKKGETAETKVMNMSINPEVEFILDKDNKVVSVSAKNDEGNFIVAKATFEGLTAEEAAKLFVQVTNENGFVVEAGDLKIEISGEDAQKIFNSVKDNINVYLGEEGLNISITLDKIDREALEAELKNCMRELADDEIAKLTEDEIIAKVKEMRDQTKDLNTEKLKEMYYEFRAQTIEEAEFDAYIDAIKNSAIFNKDQIVAYYNEFIAKMDQLEAKFVEEFMSKTSVYQQKMQEFIAAKQELLQARLDEASELVLAAKEAAVAAAQTALNAAENAAQIAVNTINSTFATVKTTLQTAIQAIVSQLPTEINATINTKVGEVEVNFEANFKSAYGEYIHANYWNGLAPTPSAAA